MTEAELTKNVIDTCRLFGWKVAHFRPGLTKAGNWITAMQGDKGFPDIVAARRGWVIFAELKVGYNKPTAEQQEWGAELAQKGNWERSHDYHVWTDKDWEDDTITKALR